MFGSFRFLIFTFLILGGSLTAGQCCCEQYCNRFYIGAFGGGICSTSSAISQMGTALFPEMTDVGPLAVEARGHLHKKGAGFGGAQMGYEWRKEVDACSWWTISPAAEFEAFWFSRGLSGHLFNRVDTDRLPEHDFLDTFHMVEGVYLANFILSVNNTWGLAPYIGGGVGPTRIALHNADSLQVEPLEAGINHFNSDRDDSSWTWAAQFKAGLRYSYCRFHIFGEYRFLYADTSHFIFGSTVYPNHVHTTPWNVKIRSMKNNAFAFGIQFDL